MSEVMSTDREPLVTRVPEVMTEEQKILYGVRLKGQVLRKLTIAFIDAKKKFGWTQRDIAKRMGVDESEISHILSGKRKNLSLEKIAIYARAMNRRAEIHFIDPEEAVKIKTSLINKSSILSSQQPSRLLSFGASEVQKKSSWSVIVSEPAKNLGMIDA